jgi:hypothetical protein
VLHRPTERQSATEKSTDEGQDRLRDFFVRELPSGSVEHAAYLARAVVRAGERYDRYQERKREWFNYATRRDRLTRIANLAAELAGAFCDLDLFSRDALYSRADPTEVETLIGSLALISKEATVLAAQVQSSGKPRDLAEERWMVELADIYENAFGKLAGVWGSAGETRKQRGTFYRLLELGRPASFHRHGKLSVRQVGRTLKKRSPKAAPRLDWRNKQSCLLSPIA